MAIPLPPITSQNLLHINPLFQFFTALEEQHLFGLYVGNFPCLWVPALVSIIMLDFEASKFSYFHSATVLDNNQNYLLSGWGTRGSAGGGSRIVW